MIMMTELKILSEKIYRSCPGKKKMNCRMVTVKASLSFPMLLDGGQQFLMEILVMDCNLDPKKPDLHYAVCGQTEMVMTLVETYDCPLEAIDDCNSTPLCLAIMNGKVDTAKTLIDLGAQLDVENIYGTPLYIAGFGANLDGVKLMYEKYPESKMLQGYKGCLQSNMLRTTRCCRGTRDACSPRC